VIHVVLFVPCCVRLPPPRAPPVLPYTSLFRSRSKAKPARGTSAAWRPWSSSCSTPSAPSARTSAARTRSSCASLRPKYARSGRRSEEHTSELQSRGHLVCRLLLEKKNDEQTTG